MRKRKQHIIVFLKLVFAIAIITYLVLSGKLDFSQIPDAFKFPHWIAISVCILFLQTLLATWRWKLLLNGVGVRERYLNLWRFTWIGMLFNNVMLGSVGGDVVKMFYVVRHFPNQRAVTGMTVLLDRVLGLYCMVVLAFVCLTLAPQDLMSVEVIASMRHGIGLFIIVSLCIAPLFFSKRLRKQIPLKGVFAELADAIQRYRSAKRYVLGSLVITFMSHSGMVVIFYLISLALAGGVPVIALKTMGFLAPVGMITVAIPVAPAGLGVGQAAFSKLFEWVHAPLPTLGANTATLYQLLTMGINLVGLVAYMTHRQKKAADPLPTLAVEAYGER